MTGSGAVAIPSPSLRRVEAHLGTVITVSALGVDDTVAAGFFARIRQLEALLSRFRPDSQVSLLATGALHTDAAAPEVREVLHRCEALRELTDGDFDHEPRRRSGDPADPVLDVNAFAKGWIAGEAAVVLQLGGASEFFVNAGGDIIASIRPGGPWRVGIQHPTVRDAVLGRLELQGGAVATSGAYERGRHIRSDASSPLVSVTVVGPDLGVADALSTAVFASGQPTPAWWDRVDPAYGLLTLGSGGRLRWQAPAVGPDVRWITRG